MGVCLNSNYWKVITYLFFTLYFFIKPINASDSIPLFSDKSLLSIRSEYAKSVPHEIPYKTLPGSSLRYKVDRLDPEDPGKPKDEPFSYQEGCIYFYGKGKAEQVPDGAYYQSRLTYARILLGMNCNHPWSKHINFSPEKGLSVLIGLTNLKTNNGIAKRVTSEFAREDLRYLEGCYSTAMHIASVIDSVNSYEGLVLSIDNSFQNIMSQLNVNPLKDFIIRIWRDRQVYLKTHLDTICDINKVSKQEILDAIIDRKNKYKLNGTDLNILLLKNSTLSFYPLEATLFKSSNPELFDQSME